MPAVYIVILNYTRWQDVKDCLYSVFHSTFKSFTVIVIDNNSQDNSLQHLMNWIDDGSVSTNNIPKTYKFFQAREIGPDTDFGFPQLFFVQNDSNAGFAAGNNLVISSLLKNDGYIWLLNPDIIAEESTLGELIKFANQVPSKSIIGSVVKSFSNRREIILYGGAKINFNSATVSLIQKENKIHEIDFICGGSLFAHTRHFKDIGLLPEEYFLIWEEADWCYMARQKGYKMMVCKTAVCYDKISTSIGKGFLANYYYTLNGLLFLKKYRSKKIGSALFFAILRFLKRLGTGKWASANGVLQGVLTFTKKVKNESE